MFVILVLSGCVTPGPISVSPPEFDEGLMLYNQRDYRRAELIFNQVIARYPGAPFLIQAQWMLARSIEGQEDLERALMQYQLFVQNFPTHPYRSEANLKITRLEEKLHSWRKDRQVHLAVVLPLSHEFSVGLLERWMDRLEKVGVDTLVVKVFHNGGQNVPLGVFFQTLQAPVLMDGLTMLVRAAHRHHLKVFAWMSVRQMNWKIQADSRWADLKYDSLKMGLIPTEGLDLFQPAVQDYIIALYQDLAGYSLDGIVFGDDLFYKTEEGLGLIARQQFTMDFGEVFLPKGLNRESLMVSNDVFWRWIGWKSRQVYHFLNVLKQAVHKTNPLLQFGLMLSEESILNPLQALKKNSQDLLEAKHQMLDYYVIGVEFAGTQDDFIRLPQIAARSYQLMGQPEKVLLRIRIQGTPDASLSRALAPMVGFDPSMFLRLSALGHEMGLEPLEFIFRPRSAQ